MSRRAIEAYLSRHRITLTATNACVIAVGRRSWWWGTSRVEATITPAGGETLVRLTSCPVLPTTLLDFGTNLRNIADLAALVRVGAIRE